MLYMYRCMYINICMSRLMVSSISLAPCHFMCAGPVYQVGKRCCSWRIEMVHVSFCHLNNVSNAIVSNHDFCFKLSLFVALTPSVPMLGDGQVHG